MAIRRGLGGSALSGGLVVTSSGMDAKRKFPGLSRLIRPDRPVITVIFGRSIQRRYREEAVRRAQTPEQLESEEVCKFRLVSGPGEMQTTQDGYLLTAAGPAGEQRSHHVHGQLRALAATGDRELPGGTRVRRSFYIFNRVHRCGLEIFPDSGWQWHYKQLTGSQ